MSTTSQPPPLQTRHPSDTQPLWRRVAGHVLGGTLLCTGVALFITLLFHDNFWRNWVLSMCIGFCIQGLIELGRYSISAWLRRRGHHSPQVLSNWPGWPIMGPFVLLAALLGYGMGANLGAWLLGSPVPVQLGGSVRGLVVVLTITAGVSVAATYSFFVRSRLATLAAQAEAARRQASENQLMLLQSQLEPHMLFNTLANLRVLISLDAPRAQAMLDHLIRYLRATLGASQGSLHPLSVEFARLDDYLALMALRMGPRLQVQLHLPTALRDMPVPPLLLQPLVENSIRHGLEPQVAGGRIEVRADVLGDRLVLTVRDTGAGLAPTDALEAHTRPTPHTTDTPNTPPHRPDAAPGSHYGTRHVAERLATLYGERARFSLRPAPDAEGGTLAEVSLPLPTAATATTAAAATSATRTPAV